MFIKPLIDNQNFNKSFFQQDFCLNNEMEKVFID